MTDTKAALKLAASKTYTSFAHFPIALWRWTNFHAAELDCRGTGEFKINIKALDKLQALRDLLGVPLYVTSAYRSEIHNEECGGVPKSEHLKAKAYDIRMQNHDPVVFETAARKVGFTGIGYYPHKGFMHLDTGKARSWGKKWKKGWHGAEFKGYAAPAPLPALVEKTKSAPVSSPARGAGRALR